MYEEQWKECRKRWLMLWKCLAGGFFLVGIVGFLLSQMRLGNLADYLFPAVGGAWMLAFAVSGIRLTYWRCPRCRNYYFVRAMMTNQLARRCLHCGLKKWDEGGVEEE
jgi:hypothetical protein